MTFPQSSENPGEKETGRLEAFSDGVFSIAMTLLVLDLNVPKPMPSATFSAHELWVALAKQWPSYLAFVTSFFTVLVMWVNHHGIFRLIRRTDYSLMFANGLLLLLVTAVPFPTALVARYLDTPAASTACGVYAGTFVVISSSYALLLVAAKRRGGRLLVHGAKAEVARRIRDCYLVGTPLYAVAALVMPVAPWATIGICTVLWVFWSLNRGDSGLGFGR